MAPRPIIHEPQTPEQQREERVENIIALAVILLIIVGGTILFLNWNHARHSPAVQQPYDNSTVYPVETLDNPELGSDNAPVVMIEFSDYGCSSCAAFHATTLQRLRQEYIDSGEVRFVHRDFPLDAIHPFSREAAIAARCAGEQGRFWEFGDALYANQSRLGEALLNETAAALGLNLTQFQACRSSGTYDAAVERDYVAGVNQGGVSATPTFFIDGRRIVGNQDYAIFKQLIDSELARVKSP